MHQPLSLTHAILTLLFLIPTCLSVIIPHCFFPGESPDLQPTNLDDCKGALRELVGEPGFIDHYRFSRNQRIGVKVPKWWRSGECIILVSCSTKYDAETLSYADVLRSAKKVIDQCIDVPNSELPGETPLGGIDKIGTSGSFFVAVNGRVGDQPLGWARNLTGVLDYE